MTQPRPAKIAITTDYMFEGGAEEVTDTLCAAFPDSDVYTSMTDLDLLQRYPHVQKAAQNNRLYSGPVQKLWPLVHRIKGVSAYHLYWLCFMVAPFQGVKSHDTVIVTCSAQSKLFRLPNSARTIVYFHTPTRWLYPGLMSSADLEAIPWLFRQLIKLFNVVLGPLDRLGIKRLKAAEPVWLCNSRFTKDNIARIHGIDCEVLYPPVDTGKFQPVTRNPQDFFLYHGRITFQKRVDVAIKGCLQARKKLKISGHCADPALMAHLQSIVSEAEAADPSLKGLITFLGRTSDAELLGLFANCKALIFPPREDFGITPIEAISAGIPVIAFNQGGALDYIKPRINGCFFEAQTGDSLARAVTDFDQSDFDPVTIANSLPDMGRDRFRQKFRDLIETQGQQT